MERREGGTTGIAVFVVTSPGAVTGRRALAVRDAVMSVGRGSRELFEIVEYGDVGGDTLGSVLWAPGMTADRECVGYTFSPGDSIRPASQTCNRELVSSVETWNPRPLYQTVFEAGGNAVVLVEEDYSGSFRGLRGFVLRCRGEGSTPDCG